MARPSSLTPAIQRRITDGVRQGAHPRQAARRADVAESTFSGWLANPAPLYQRFRDAIFQAEAEAELEAVEEVRRVDKRWWLERRHPDRWNRAAEPRAQAAAVVNVSAGHEPGAAAEEKMIYFTPDEIRIAAAAFLNRKRIARGEPPQLEDPAEALRGLIVEAVDADNPADG